MDGLSDAQRKVMYAVLFKHAWPDDDSEIKVAQLKGIVAQHTNYHHSEDSLSNTIVGLAANYVGSNNVELLQPRGQFGTRHATKPSADRYIYTRPSVYARMLFRKEDDDLLALRGEDGVTAEPHFFLPVLPLVLLNGAFGLCPGWSTDLEPHSPLNVCAALRALIALAPQPDAPLPRRKRASDAASASASDSELTSEACHALPPLRPWWRGSTAMLHAAPETAPTDGRYVVRGRWRRASPTELHISELPPRTRTVNYCNDVLVPLTLNGSDTGESAKRRFIQGYTEHHTETTIEFRITAPAPALDALCGSAATESDRLRSAAPIWKTLRLEESFSTRGATLFDECGRVRTYTTTHEILRAFYHVRLHFYAQRRSRRLAELEYDAECAERRARFLELVASREFDVARPRSALDADLTARNLALAPSPLTGRVPPSLLDIPLSRVSDEKRTREKKRAEECRAAAAALRAETPASLWLRDLDEFETRYAADVAGMQAAALYAPPEAPPSARKRAHAGDAVAE